MIIEFGRWRLVPVDKLNWELCHLHASTRGKNEGVERWHRLGRFYQWNTLPNAIGYAADAELRESRRTEALGLLEALAEWRRTFDALMDAAQKALGADGGALEGNDE